MKMHNTCGVLLAILLSFGFLAPASAAEGAFYGAMETEYPGWFKESFLDLSEDLDEAEAEGKRLMLLFHQAGCPYCNRLVEHNLAQHDIQQLMREKLDVIAINMWGDREVVDLNGSTVTEKQFAADLRVQFTPTVLFLSEQGEVVLRINGYLPPESFKVALGYVIDRQEQQISYQEYLARHRPQAARAALNNQLFFSQPPFDLAGLEEPLAVYFEQAPCPNCDYLHREVLSADSVLKPASRVRSVQLDIWSDTPLVTPAGTQTTARAWAKALGITFAPTIVLFNAKGEEVIRSEAVFKRFHTASLFDYLLTGAYLTEPSFQRFLSARSERIRASGKDVDIWR